MARKAVIPFVLVLILALVFLSYPAETLADEGATIDEKIAQASALSENGTVGMELSQEEIREFLLARGYSELAFLSHPTETVADKGATIDEKIAQASALSENGTVGMELSQEEIREFLLARGYSEEEAEWISGPPGRMMAELRAAEENTE